MINGSSNPTQVQPSGNSGILENFISQVFPSCPGMHWYILSLSSHSKVSFPRFILRMNLKLTQIEFTSSDYAFIDHNMKVCCLENIVSRCRFKLCPVNPERIILVKYQIGRVILSKSWVGVRTVWTGSKYPTIKTNHF